MNFLVLKRKIKTFSRIMLEKTIGMALAIPVYLGIVVVSKLMHINVVSLMSSRIGHFTVNTELHLLEVKEGLANKDKSAHIYFNEFQPICNSALDRMWRDRLQHGPAFILKPVLSLNRLFNTSHEAGFYKTSDRDVHNLLDKHGPTLQLGDSDEAKGWEVLRSVGLKRTDKFVCLLVRDSAYLDYVQPPKQERSWSYHSYRDSNIANYVQMAEYVAERGYFLFRMGVKVNERLLSDNPRVIDYANSDIRSEFMDIFLGAKCSFCISTSSGWDGLPQIFRRPVMYVNILPFGLWQTSRNSTLGLFKKLVDMESGRMLNLREVFERGLGFLTQTVDFESKKVKIIENEPIEILQAVGEMLDRMEQRRIYSEYENRLQARFLEIYERQVRLYEKQIGKLLHGEIRARYSTDQLVRHPSWLEV